jgi:hypothetical protein
MKRIFISIPIFSDVTKETMQTKITSSNSKYVYVFKKYKLAIVF